MSPLDDHVASRIHKDQRRVTRVGFHEPDDNGDIIGHALEHHGDGAVDLKEIDSTAIVVGEGAGLGL